MKKKQEKFQEKFQKKFQKKFFVASNLATSLDGKIATESREYFPLGTAYDRTLMRKIRDEFDCVVFGAQTLRTFKKACLGLKKKKEPGVKYCNVVISQKLAGIDPEWDFFKDPQIKRIILVQKSGYYPQCTTGYIK